MRKRLYWESEKKRVCRLCESEEETWEHVWEVCRYWDVGGKSWKEMIGWILGKKEKEKNGC